jgi:hypothetical protein
MCPWSRATIAHRAAARLPGLRRHSCWQPVTPHGPRGRRPVNHVASLTEGRASMLPCRGDRCRRPRLIGPVRRGRAGCGGHRHHVGQCWRQPTLILAPQRRPVASRSSEPAPVECRRFYRFRWYRAGRAANGSRNDRRRCWAAPTGPPSPSVPVPDPRGSGFPRSSPPPRPYE